MIYGAIAQLNDHGIPTSLAAPAGADLRDVIDIVRTEGIESAEIARASNILAEVALQYDLGTLRAGDDPAFDPESPVFSVLSSRRAAAALADRRENGASISLRIVSTRNADHVVLDAGDPYALEILSLRLLTLGWKRSGGEGIEAASFEGREVRWDSASFDAGVPRLSSYVLGVARKPSRSGRLAEILKRWRPSSRAVAVDHAAETGAPEFLAAEKSLRDLSIPELTGGTSVPTHSLSIADILDLQKAVHERYIREIDSAGPTNPTTA